MNELETLRAENARLRLRTRSVLDTAVVLLESGATRAAVVQHLENEVTDLLSPVQEKAGQP